MRGRGGLGRALLPASLLGLGLVLPATAAAAPVAVDGWGQAAGAFTGNSLAFTNSWQVAPDGRFVYWRVDAYRVGLGPKGFRGAVGHPISVSTQAGPTTRALVAGGPGAAFAVVASGQGFAPPVIWCCTRDGIQSVLESDGRPAAPVAVAVAVDGSRVRFLLGRRATWTLVTQTGVDEQGETRKVAGFPGRPQSGAAAMAPGLVAWVDDPVYGISTTLRVGVPSDIGVRGLRVRPQPGPVRGVWAAKGTIVVANLVNGRTELARYDLPALRRQVVWRGTGLGPVAVGGGTVAAVVGHGVLASRSGSLRTIRRSAGVIAGLAVNGPRVAVFEQTRIRGARQTVVRLVRIR
jgi:hypothetical protein